MAGTSFKLLMTLAYVSAVWTSSSSAESCRSVGRVKSGHSSAVKDDNGTPLCAVDAPSESLTPVRSLLDCDRICSQTTGCWNFNYFRNTKRCDIFRFMPSLLVLGVPNCKHYQVSCSSDVFIMPRLFQYKSILHEGYNCCHVKTAKGKNCKIDQQVKNGRFHKKSNKVKKHFPGMFFTRDSRMLRAS